MSKRVIVIGGGAAGMMAAGVAASRGLDVKLVEQNKILGKKLLITGKGRCNLTNACDDVEDLIRNVPTNGTFLYSAFYGFTNYQTMDFFEKLGVALKTERGGRVFPASDKSADVVSALRRFLTENNVEIINDRVDDVLTDDGHVSGVVVKKRGKIFADSVILSTGGMSYQSTGSTGDGYTWAENLGHQIKEPRPSLVPLETKEDWYKRLAGLTLKNIAIRVTDSRNKRIYEDFGEMMFAHFGLTGPVILSASAHMRKMNKDEYKLTIDLKPALNDKQLDARILRDFSSELNKDFKNSLKGILPSKMISEIIALSGIDPYKKINSVTKEERSNLVRLLKNLEFSISNFCPIDQAIITSGGINVKEINPSTMESKLVPGLFFAGEIIDVDAYTGGFNLQIAFSTGHLAGSCC